ncbi:hypothetical protein CSIRO_3030 [Bradyrhizobiaceae bacterium SG-6C]|nr:hypothetical protein CSIRO_3030 [Bradyrhizobiaceae bacterium SG-6C]
MNRAPADIQIVGKGALLAARYACPSVSGAAELPEKPEVEVREAPVIHRTIHGAEFS